MIGPSGLSIPQIKAFELAYGISMKKIMVMFGFVSGLLAPAHGESDASGSPTGDYVVLLHGLGRTRLSMARIERVLQRQNYRVINVSYPSTRLSIEAASQQVFAKTLKGEIRDESA